MSCYQAASDHVLGPICVVAVDADHRGRGGMERVLVEVLPRLAQTHRVILVSTSIDPELEAHVDWRPVRLPRLPGLIRLPLFTLVASLVVTRVRRRDLASVVTLGPLVSNRVDLVWAHFSHHGLRARTGDLAPGYPRGPRRMHRVAVRCFALAMERLTLRPGHVGGIAAVSEQVAEEIRSAHPGIEVAIVPNGVDHDRFSPDRTGANESTLDEPLVLFVGGDWERKGVPVLVDAFARVAIQRPTTRLLVVGDGDPDDLRRWSPIDLGDRLQHLPPQSDIEIWYRRAVALVLVSAYETSGLVGLEAAACGCPVIATPVGDLPELIGDNEAGILLGTGPPLVDELCRALLIVLDDQEARGLMSAAAQRRAARWSWDRTADLLGRALVSSGRL